MGEKEVIEWSAHEAISVVRHQEVKWWWVYSCQDVFSGPAKKLSKIRNTFPRIRCCHFPPPTAIFILDSCFVLQKRILRFENWQIIRELVIRGVAKTQEVLEEIRRELYSWHGSIGRVTNILKKGSETFFFNNFVRINLLYSYSFVVNVYNGKI